jgi:glycosyltransferase involved in cell wall biosynthesis
MAKVTIVSCFYMLPRPKHAIGEYMSWIQNFLTYVDTPIIMFSEGDVLEMMKQMRKEAKLENKFFPIEKPFHQLKFSDPSWIKTWENQVQKSEFQHIQNQELYRVWANKSFFVQEAIQKNPFDSDIFVWCDAGCWRELLVAQACGPGWPSPKRMIPNRLHILAINPIEPWIEKMKALPNDIDQKSFVEKLDTSNTTIVGGTILIGDKVAWEAWVPVFEKTLTYFIEFDRFAGDDQSVIAASAFWLHKQDALTKPVFLKSPDHNGFCLINGQPCGDMWFSFQPFFRKEDEEPKQQTQTPIKILLISSGAGTWPNDGWGAVENLVADFEWALKEQGVIVEVYHNQEFGATLEKKVAEFHPDLIHCEYDDHIIHLVPCLQKYPTMKILLTSHYAWLSQPYQLVQDGYMSRFLFACDLAKKSNLTLAVLSPEIAKTCKDLAAVPEDKLWVFPNGTRTDKIQCRPPVHESAICVGKIEKRKKQTMLQACKRIDFVGPISDNDFVVDEHYKGKWTRNELYQNLTNYPCLVLISEAEAHPLVIGEALAAGCAILCNEVSAANLPREKPWIRVLADGPLTLEDLDRNVTEMCAIGRTYRNEIREWACANLDWRLRAKTYLEKWFGVGTTMTAAQPIACPETKEAAIRFALVGPGIMPIPPTGWGAVEQIIWDHYKTLKAKGHHVTIINTPDRNEIKTLIQEGNYDVVHIHYDVFADLADELNNKCVLLTSHYPYIDKLEQWGRDGFHKTFMKMSAVGQKKNVYFFPVSEKDVTVFESMGGGKGKTYLMPNGVDVNAFQLTETPHFGERSVVLGKIESRKRQHLTYWFPDVDYIGKGDFRHANFRGELGHEVLYRILSDFGNMILLSEAENGTPLAVKEGLAAGLGCVLSKAAAFEFKEPLPWITIVPEEDLGNQKKLYEAIKRNRDISARMRKEIREWTYRHWDWNALMDTYIQTIRSLLAKA